MQTFLPYPDFAASAAALDPKRLGKQRVEALQVLRALTWPTYGWKRHPAVRMWAGYTEGVAAYGLVACLEWISRGGADTVAGTIGVDLAAAATARPRAAGVDRRRARARQPPAALVRKDPASTARCSPTPTRSCPTSGPSAEAEPPTTARSR